MGMWTSTAYQTDVAAAAYPDVYRRNLGKIVEISYKLETTAGVTRWLIEHYKADNLSDAQSVLLLLDIPVVGVDFK